MGIIMIVGLKCVRVDITVADSSCQPFVLLQATDECEVRNASKQSIFSAHISQVLLHLCIDVEDNLVLECQVCSLELVHVLL